MDMRREDEVFEYLDKLREDGSLLAWGATYYLMKGLKMEYREAKDWDVWWRNILYNAEKLENFLKGK